MFLALKFLGSTLMILSVFRWFLLVSSSAPSGLSAGDSHWKPNSPLSLFVHPLCSRVCRFVTFCIIFWWLLAFPPQAIICTTPFISYQRAPLPSIFHNVCLRLLYFSYCTIATTSFKINFTSGYNYCVMIHLAKNGNTLKSIMWSPGVQRLSVWVEFCLPQKHCWNPNPQYLGQCSYLYLGSLWRSQNENGVIRMSSNPIWLGVPIKKRN